MLNRVLLYEIANLILTDRHAMAKFAVKLNETFFETQPEVFEVIQIAYNHYKENGNLASHGEMLRVINELRETNHKLKNLLSDPEYILDEAFLNHADYDAESISKTIVCEIESSKIVEATNEIVEQLSANKKLTIEQIVDLYNRVGSDVKDLTFEFNKNELEIDFDDIVNSFNKTDDVNNNIPTGLPLLDRYILGLNRNGEIGIFVAPPNRGKTALLLNVARNMVMSGYRVLFITGETHIDDLKKRFWAGVFNTAINDLSEVDRAKAFKAYIGAQRIGGSIQWYSFIENSSFTPTDLDFVVKKYREQTFKSPDVIILDYFDLMLPNASSKNDQLRTQINKIYKDVRRIAVKYHIPIWTASQTNREGSDTLLITDKNIGEDYQKVCNADKIVSFNQTMYEVDNKVARLFVMKTRNSTGKNKVIQVKTEFDKMKFKDIRELTFKEHMKLMAVLEHENRRSKKDDGRPGFKPRKPL